MIEDIQKAFNPLIDALGYDVAWPNVQANYNGTHLQVSYLFSRSEPATYECSRLPGIVQVSVYTPDGEGAINAGVIGDAVINAFPIATKITQGSTNIHIDQQPYAAPPIIGDGWHHLPINIPFEVYR